MVCLNREADKLNIIKIFVILMIDLKFVNVLRIYNI
jgi:hypothetical protein